MFIALAGSPSAQSMVIIGIVAILFVAVLILNQTQKPRRDDASLGEKHWPLGVNGNFITNAERSFFVALKVYAGDKYVICPKVRLGDVLFVYKNTDPSLRTTILNSINCKHLDFLLLDAVTLEPVYAIELDDSSHHSALAQKRDAVKDKALHDAGLAIVRLPAQGAYAISDIEKAFQAAGVGGSERDTSYRGPELVGFPTGPDQLPDPASASLATIGLSGNAVRCPKCNVPMVLRQATKGVHAGNSFFGCPNYPQCRETKMAAE